MVEFSPDGTIARRDCQQLTPQKTVTLPSAAVQRGGEFRKMFLIIIE